MNRDTALGGQPLRLLVVGGGFTGAVFVINTIRSMPRLLDIIVAEPRAELGRGVAYGTDDPSHRINVPSARMGLFRDDGGEATRWLFARGFLPDAGSDDGLGRFFVPRQAYGAFVADALRRAVADAGDRVRLVHLRDSVTRIEHTGEGWRASTGRGDEKHADFVALCFGHAAPALPCPISGEVRRRQKFVADPWAAKALGRIGASDSVLVVGAGLTMADVVASLRSAGRQGHITVISRRGLTPLEQGQFLGDIDLFAGAPPPSTALGLLRLMRKRIREAAPSLEWQAFIDSLRARLPLVWSGLPSAERRRVRRWLLPYWDAHRFRMAPQVGDVLIRAQQDGNLSFERAALIGLGHRQDGFAAALRRPGGAVEERLFEAVVLCTGPNRNISSNPLVASLLAEGVARVDEAGLGLAVDLTSRVFDAQNRPWPNLIALGPMTRGSFGEMTGAPDIAGHIERIMADLFCQTGIPKRNRA